VQAADCAEAALELVEACPAPAAPPAALVSDVAMPGMDGLALARRLRARWPGLPVLLLSGYAEAMLDHDLAAEGIGFLAKPFAPSELPERLAALLATGGGGKGGTGRVS
jgi:two-component system, cell cycle sensor histidine kinase and response regulator CckA